MSALTGPLPTVLSFLILLSIQSAEEPTLDILPIQKIIQRDII
jgi:hypothetical protein